MIEKEYTIDCDGCLYSFDDALYNQNHNNLFLATSKDDIFSYPDQPNHFFHTMVNNDGIILIGY